MSDITISELPTSLFLMQPEEPSQLIERSVSMGRLNFRDFDSNHMRNGAHRSRVKERSYLFQGDSAKPAPKILISSVSEDRSATSPPFRKAAARSWSIEDFLTDSSQVGDSNSVVKDTKNSANEVLTNSPSNSPQLSYTHSPTDSSVPECGNTESVVGDSAISSPDSWVESEFGVTPEKFCESQSDSSLCDSGTAWEVYRATPVEVTNLDEGFVPSLEEDRASDEQLIVKAYKDEGIFSLETTQEQTQEHPEENQEEVQKEKEAEPESNKQHMIPEQTLDQSNAEIMQDVDSKQMDTSLPPKEQQPSSDENILADSVANDNLETSETNTETPIPDHTEEPVKQTSGEESILEESKETVDAQDHKGAKSNDESESLSEGSNSGEATEGTRRLKTDSPVEEIGEDPRDESVTVTERHEGVKETHDETNEGVLRDHPDPQESIMPPTGQEGAPSIPLISISSEPEEHNEEGTCDPERQTHAGDEEVDQPEKTGFNGNDKNVNSPQYPDDQSCDSSDINDKKHDKIPSIVISEDVKPTTSEQTSDIENGHLDETYEPDVIKSSDKDTSDPHTMDNNEMIDNKEMSEAQQEGESQTDNPDEDLIAQTSTDDKLHPVNTELDGEMAIEQQSTLDSVHSDLNGKMEVSSHETASAPRNMDFLANIDRSSPTEDLVGDPIEPMDLFYPDKEEPMLTDPPDTEMQSWPSVLSVSALQPAPASESGPDDQPLDLLGEDFENGLDLMPESDEVNLVYSAVPLYDLFTVHLDSCLPKFSISVFFYCSYV